VLILVPRDPHSNFISPVLARRREADKPILITPKRDRSPRQWEW